MPRHFYAAYAFHAAMSRLFRCRRYAAMPLPLSMMLITLRRYYAAADVTLRFLIRLMPYMILFAAIIAAYRR